MMRKIVIVGGVAGGASAAARARRLDERAEITVVESGDYVGFANCGLPYHIGGAIADRNDLVLQTPESLGTRFNLNILIRHRAVKIDRENRQLIVQNLNTGARREADAGTVANAGENLIKLDYDVLILSPGARPGRPPLPGIELPGVFNLWTIPDLDLIMNYLDGGIQQAAVIGGGFIGLEAAENLAERGIKTTIVEAANQVLCGLDPEMAKLVENHLTANGVQVLTGTRLLQIEPGESNQSQRRLKLLETTTGKNGQPRALDCELVILAVGARPRIELAAEAGLEIGARGGICTDNLMKTSDPAIFAVGDAAETHHLIGGESVLVPLAGPANRQGRAAADNLTAGHVDHADYAGHADHASQPSRIKPQPYRGSLGTSICKVFKLAAAQTGYSEKVLRARNAGRIGAPVDWHKIYLFPDSHAGYYPGAEMLGFKLIYDRSDGRVLGAQIIGADGVDKRIDIIATAIAGKMTVEDLAALELSYAPPYNSARDPVNQAGMIAANIRSGLHLAINADELMPLLTAATNSDVAGGDSSKIFLLDVRTPEEYRDGHLSGAVNIELDQLRQRLDELPLNREIIVYCQVGFRGYLAQRILVQHGFEVKNLLGGYQAWQLFR